MTPPAPHPTLEDVQEAARRISAEVRRTPLVASPGLSERVGVPVHLKLESEQETGSFKLRGAANTLLALTPEERRRGVVAVSSGNHGRAVARMASRLGIDATICLSDRVPAVKRGAIEALGARVVVPGPGQDDADREARRLMQEEGLVFVHPFDDPRVIAGQGTIALEVLEALPATGTIIVPLSGGGLVSGIATAARGVNPDIAVFGVSQDRGPAMHESLRAGRIVEVEETDTLADALAGGLGAENRHTFDMCRALLAATTLVTEEQIGGAMRFLHEAEGLTVEGGGAVGVAALLAGRVEPRGATVVVISGGNVAPETMSRVLAIG